MARSFQKQTPQAVLPAKTQLGKLKVAQGMTSKLSEIDATTIAGSATGQFTNMKHYRNQQIHTISQEDASDRPGVTSTTSMFNKFIKPVDQGNPSSRRPITANAAMGGGNRHQNTLAKANAVISQEFSSQGGVDNLLG